MDIQTIRLGISFVLGVSIVLWVGRKNLPAGLLLGSFTFGFLALPIRTVAERVAITLTDPSILLLAAAVGMIPIIGGVLEGSGMMDHLVQNMRIGKKGFVAFAPAVLGMLPVPGGALFSAPLLKKVETGVSDNVKAASNVWYRHVAHLIYPLDPALLAEAKMAGLELYSVIPFLILPFVFLLAVGQVFFLRQVKGSMEYTGAFSPKYLAMPLGILLSAPLIDVTLRRTLPLPYLEIATLAAVTISLILACWLGKFDLRRLRSVAAGAKPWKFSLIIISIFVFINILRASEMPALISSLSLPFPLLAVILGFLLGVAAGETQLPFAIVAPVVVATQGSIGIPQFAYMYTSMFLGSLVSPAHACVSVTLEYFRVGLKDYLRTLGAPTLVSLAIIFALAAFGFGL
ncbi:MAG: DUF401 family protein [archaeon]